MVKKRASIGRQKISIAKIPKKNHLQVTFSKRRSGLFKKASELCTLCGVEIAIIVFSPAEKVFSFGHPEVESILDRYLTRNPPPESSAHQLIEAHRNANVREFNIHLTQILNQLEAEKKRGEALDQIGKSNQRQFWWEAPFNQLGLHELEQLRASMEELKKNVVKQANKILVGSTTNSSQFLAVNGIGSSADLFENKHAEFNASSTMPNVYNFGYGNELF